jgi:hypothetical protein
VEDADAPDAQERQAELDGDRRRGKRPGHGDAVLLAPLRRRVLLGPQIAHAHAFGQACGIHHLLQVLTALGAAIQQRAHQVRAGQQQRYPGKPRSRADIDERARLVGNQRHGAKRILDVRRERRGFRRCDQALRCHRDQIQEHGEGIRFHACHPPRPETRFT